MLTICESTPWVHGRDEATGRFVVYRDVRFPGTDPVRLIGKGDFEDAEDAALAAERRNFAEQTQDAAEVTADP